MDPQTEMDIVLALKKIANELEIQNRILAKVHGMNEEMLK